MPQPPPRVRRTEPYRGPDIPIPYTARCARNFADLRAALQAHPAFNGRQPWPHAAIDWAICHALHALQNGMAPEATAYTEQLMAQERAAEQAAEQAQQRLQELQQEIERAEQAAARAREAYRTVAEAALAAKP